MIVDHDPAWPALFVTLRDPARDDRPAHADGKTSFVVAASRP